MIKIFLLVFFVLSTEVLAASPGEKTFDISGIISEETSGETVLGASIALYDTSQWKEKTPIRGAISNKYGFYSIPGVKPGKYTLVVSGISYKPIVRQINLEKSNLTFNGHLEIDSYMTEEVVVSGDRDLGSTKSISSVKINPDYISKMPSLGGEQDIFRALQLLPGVNQGSELSSGLYVRGGSPDQNLTLLDGVIVYNPSHLGGFLSTFNTDAIRDIKLIKGAFPAEYGGRMSSVLDMTMKEGTKEKISGAGGITLLSSRLTIEGPISEESTFMISGRRMYLDQLMALLPESEDAPRYYFYDLNAKVNYKLSDEDRIFASGMFARDVLAPPPDEEDNFSIDWGNKTGNLRWRHIANSKLFTNFSLIYTEYWFQTEIFDEYDDYKESFGVRSEISDITVRGELEYFPVENHVIKAGIEETWHNFKSFVSENFEDAIDQNSAAKKKINTHDFSIFVQDEWQATGLLKTNLGGRLYYFQEGDYLRFEPRFSASYAVNENFFVKGSAALAHQFLHLIVRNDITLPTDLWFPSSTDIKPGYSWQGVLGIETTFGDGKYLFTAEAYYKDMQNLYEYKDNSQFTFGMPVEDQFTGGSGYAYGIELFLNKRVGDFTGWLGYTLAWSKRRFDSLNSGIEFFPRYDRRHDIKLTLAYELSESWEIGASWVYATGQAYTMPEGAYVFIEQRSDGSYIYEKYNYSGRNEHRLPAFHKLDLNIMHKFEWFGLPFQFTISIYNAYNRKNPFAWYIDYEYNPETMESVKVLKQMTLFPFIPTIGLSFRF